MTLETLLSERKAAISDGAMGTELMKLGLELGVPSVLWNVDRSAEVLSVHRSYADAGADFLTTNTFGGSVTMLTRHGLEKRVEELNRTAVRLAKRAADGRCLVLGDVGPCGDFLEPVGDLTDAALAEAVRRQALCLAEEGVNGFIAETMSDPGEMHVTVSTLKQIGLPVLASYTFEKTGSSIQTMMGASPREATLVAAHAGADAVGANCGTSLDLDDYLKIAEEIVAAAHGLPVFLQPNAGTPVMTDHGNFYSVTPDEFGRWAQCAVQMGVKIIGGCCGTTPAHIAAAAAAINPDRRTP